MSTAGKSTLTRILLNYAVRRGRQPMFVDLDVGQVSNSFFFWFIFLLKIHCLCLTKQKKGELGPPGCVGAATLIRPRAPGLLISMTSDCSLD